MARGVARPPLPCAPDYRGRARAEVKTLVSAHHRSGAPPVRGRPGLRRTPANRSQLRRGQRVGVGALSRPQWRRRTPLAGLLVHRSCALEVAGDPSLAHRVARAQLVVVQTGKYHRTSSTTSDRGLPPTYFSRLRRQTLPQKRRRKRQNYDNLKGLKTG